LSRWDDLLEEEFEFEFVDENESESKPKVARVKFVVGWRDK